ncbi:FtsX-like permease family protein [Nonomuraea sp. NPDC050328]|uniref:FtsX-like permease family protein n=1 Tax=Nonomuraea sp. NPDC050328 TaxID=3364361 RepID=UPI00378BF542
MIWRGLWERRALALIVLIVAIVPVGAASIGPLYAEASRTTIVRDVLRAAPTDGRGWRYTTPVAMESGLREFTAGADFLSAPIRGFEAQSQVARQDTIVSLMWQDGQCEHVTLLEGRCPTAPFEVMVGEGFAGRFGEEVILSSFAAHDKKTNQFVARPLKVVGVYRANSPADPFWFNRSLFAALATEGRLERAEPFFITPETRSEGYLLGSGQWTDYALVFADPERITGGDLDTIAVMQARVERVGRVSSAAVFTRMGDTLRTMTRQAGALAVPTYVVVGQLVALAWLLLFQTVADLVRARSPEIALARLRGHSLPRVWRFALAEPLLLLALAYPLGVLTGRAVAQAVVRHVPAEWPPAALGAGAGALAGGLLAAAVAAWRTARRPVTEEWRRTPRRAGRGWVLDAVVLALAGMGLVELLGAGVITDASGQRTGALAVPGLIALALALLARRALPGLARLGYGRTRRRGGLGAFLALRQVARGPVTAGSMIVLATAFGLATFAVAAWTATLGNYAETARFHLGAPAVIEVGRVTPEQLAAAVAKADPSGRQAAPVIRVPGSPQMVAADPARLAEVASWDPRHAGGIALREAAARMKAQRAPRAMLGGEQVRMTVAHGRIPPKATVRFFLTIRVPGRVGPVSLPIARLEKGVTRHTWRLPAGCHKEACELRGLRGEMVLPVAGEDEFDPVVLPVAVNRLEVLSGGRWQEVDAGLTDPARWAPVDDSDPVQADEYGLELRLVENSGSGVRLVTYPDPLPAITTGQVGAKALPGLDLLAGVGVEAAVPSAAAPGLSDTGAVVDLDLADRAAFGIAPQARFEVWVREGRAAPIAGALAAAGLEVIATQRVGDLERRYAGEGPGLALLLMLVSALAAAALALGRTVLALYTAARRRRYELAALAAAGARLGALRGSLLMEQLVVVCAGMATGLVAGLLAARVALARIPQFAEAPPTPPLPFDLAPGPLALLLGTGVVVSLLATMAVSEVLLRGIQVDRLREAQA